MTRRLVQPSVLTTLLLAVAAFPSTAEDLTIVSSVTGGKGAPVTSTQYISADKVRTSDGRLDTIIDITSGRMVHIDHKKKSYSETSLEEMRAHFAELEQMLEDNPMMATMLGSATHVEVRPGSIDRTVAGYPCKHYVLTIGQKMQFDIWAAAGLRAPTNYYDASKMVYAAMGPLASRFDKMYDEMKKIDGLPLASKIDTRFIGLKVKSESEATEVRKGPIPPGTFDPPAGYKKKKSPYKK